MPLNPKAFGLAAGVMWGLALLVTTLISVSTGYATMFLNIIASIYLGYSISPLGSIIGLIYGFADASIGFYIFARIYNWLETKE
ncbi:Uncharacterised protein [uncultured archaeon]|nr:Uncharacterised protein [uncultured archaeon]